MSNKADTVFRSVVANPEVDLSQEATNITATAGGAYEAPSARTAISYTSREITVVFTADTGSTGTLVYRGNTAGTSIDFLIDVSSSALRFQDANGTQLSVTINGIDGTLTTYNAQICTRDNPLTTGASDAYITEMHIEDVAGGEWTYARVEHADAAHVAGDNFSIGGEWNGAALANAYSDAVSEVRIGTRFKSGTEFREDYSASVAATPTTGENQADPLVAMAGSSEIGDGGSTAGPAYSLSGAHVAACARRLMSPLVNARFHLPGIQGRTNLVRTTVDSRDEEYVIQGNDTGSGNPGHGNGPSGFPEVCREFGTASNLMFEEQSGSNPAFISDITTGTDFTMSMWVRWDGTAARGVISGLTGGASSTAFHDIMVLTVTSLGELEISWHYGAGSTHVVGTTDDTLTSGTWHHLAVTGRVNGSSYDVEAYIDGVHTDIDEGLVLTSPFPTGGSSSAWVFGRRNNNGTYSEEFDGAICEWKVGRELTDDEVTFEAARGQGYLLAGGKGGWDTWAHWQFRQPENGYSPARAFKEVDLGGDTYMAHLDTLCRRPLHRMTGKFQAQVLSTIYFTQPPGTADTVDQVDIAIVATNRRPGQVLIGGVPPKTVYATATLAGSAGDLEWTEFDDLTLPRDEDGQCWFYLASRIGDGSPSYHTGIAFDGLQIVPYSETPSTSYPLPWASP